VVAVVVEADAAGVVEADAASNQAATMGRSLHSLLSQLRLL
jgi:hypothetical protein